MTASLAHPGMANWQEAIPYDPERKIDSVEIFQDFIAVEGRKGGLTRLWLLNKTKEGGVDASTFRQLDFPEEVRCYLSCGTPHFWLAFARVRV